MMIIGSIYDKGFECLTSVAVCCQTEMRLYSLLDLSDLAGVQAYHKGPKRRLPDRGQLLTQSHRGMLDCPAGVSADAFGS